MTPATTTRNGHNHKAHDRNPYNSDNGSHNGEDHLLPPPLNVNSCTTVEEIHALLTHLTTQDALRTFLLKQSELEHSLYELRLDVSTPKHTSSGGQRAIKDDALPCGNYCADGETAVSFWLRVGKILQEIIHGEFAEAIVPSVEVSDLPSVTLESAAELLCGLFLREFEHAAGAGDGQNVARLFNLVLPQELGSRDTLGAKRQAAADGAGGLGAFCYVNAVTRLLQHIANRVEPHGKLVERDERSIDGKSYMPSTRGLLGGPPASGSLVPSRSADRNGENANVDVREADILLSEIGPLSFKANHGIMVCFNQVVKSKLRPLLAEAFRDVEYLISPEAGWGALMAPYKRILTEKVFDKLLDATVSYLSKSPEKRRGYAGRISELGAIRLGSDVAVVVDAVVRGGLYRVRDALARSS
ncbi:hypothetical protein B9Z19DRAFT_1121716 [Tuber borchii]|uniref:Conserved oligomeric Golgi complex subunit 4 C-terminal domain-containing protein n=1 Tax=Tuber borchii TaxID=42251 RepID=A0A2T7A256_TUBBO|nr:hypothetical protein B9Z19DRAFT_1121716 [Tuber borchii]